MKGKTVEAHKFTPLGSCKRHCNLIISQEETSKIFDNYWNLGTYQQRLMDIKNLISINSEKRAFQSKPPKKREGVLLSTRC